MLHIDLLNLCISRKEATEKELGKNMKIMQPHKIFFKFP